MVQQDKFVFGITPAPSPLNTDLTNWRAYTNDFADEINVVDEKTNILVGTIGGKGYRFDKLPTSVVSVLPYDSNIIGDVYDMGSAYIGSTCPYFRLTNGHIAVAIRASNHFENGVIVYDCLDLEELVPALQNVWVGFKPNDLDNTILEKIAEGIMTALYVASGSNYTYQTPGNPNQCKFIEHNSPNTSATNLLSTVATLNISGTFVGSTITVSEETFNYGGQTTLGLYNANAPVPVVADNWGYRTPYYTLNDDYNNMMNGPQEGWLWYYNGSDAAGNGLSFYMGINLLDGSTDYFQPIVELTATTNFNPVGVVDKTYFSNTKEAHPKGIIFAVFNKQVLNNGNNTNNVTGWFSPRWENSTKVVFLTGRDEADGVYLNQAGQINSNSIAANADWSFDGSYFHQFGIYEVNNSPTVTSWRYALDVVGGSPELSISPIATSGWDNGYSYFELTQAFMVSLDSVEYYLADYAFGGNVWGQDDYFYWSVLNDKSNQLQCNNKNTDLVIGNKFYSLYNDLSVNTIQLGLQFDQFSIV